MMRYEVLRYDTIDSLNKRVNKIIRDGGHPLDGAKPMREKNKTVFYQSVMINDSVKIEFGESAEYYI